MNSSFSFSRKEEAGMAGSNDYVIKVDMSDAKGLIDGLRAVHTTKQFETLMARACRKTAGHVRKILKDELPKDYHVKPSAIGKAVKSPEMQRMPGMAVSCCIPIEGARMAIGGDFSATGGRKGWKGIQRGKRYKIKAKIVKSGQSVLPVEMKHKGGKPPFRNLSARKLNKVAFTRNSDDRLPIEKIVGIAIPQMPMNRSEDGVQKDVKEYLTARLEHEHEFMIGKIKRR